MSLLHKTYSGWASVEKWFNTLAMVIIVVMMLMVVTDVVGRYLFNSPLPGALEITELLMVGTVYLALAYTQFVKAHISIDLLTTRYSQRNRLMVETISLFVLLAFFSLLVWQGGNMAWHSWQIKEIAMGPAARISVYPVKFMVPIGSFLICLRLIIQIAENLKALLIGGIRT